MLRLFVSALLIPFGPALVVAGTGAAPQAGLPTIDQVLEKYVSGTGGRAALEKIRSVEATGRIEIPDFNITGTIRLLQKAPDKSLNVVELDGVGRQRHGFDGVTGWSDDPQGGLRDLAGAELAEARRGAVFPRELRLREMYAMLTVSGRDTVNGRPAIVVEATPSEGGATRLSFDEESGLLVRQAGTRQTPAGPLQVTTTFHDFRTVDGVMRPHTVRQVTDQFTSVVTFTKVTHNVELDDALFRSPR